MSILGLFCISACSSGEPKLDLIAERQLEKVEAYKGKNSAQVANYSNATHGTWRYINDVTKTTTEVESYAFTRSQTGRNRFGKKLILGVSCENNSYRYKPSFDVYVRVDQVTNSILAYRFNGDEAVKYPGHSDWEGYDGITFDERESRDFINKALDKNYVYVQMSMYSGSDIEAKFSLAGFTAAFDKVYRDCWIAANS